MVPSPFTYPSTRTSPWMMRGRPSYVGLVDGGGVKRSVPDAVRAVGESRGAAGSATERVELPDYVPSACAEFDDSATVASDSVVIGTVGVDIAVVDDVSDWVSP